MDEGQEQDQYEERLKELFNTFDGSGRGSLSPEELSDLCQSLHLDDAAPTLLHALLQNQDRLTARVDFDQFKDALILVLSSSVEPPQAEEEETLQEPESPEIQPKFVKGSKRYGRRSTPELIEPISDSCRVTGADAAEDMEDNDDSAVPRKRERWNASTEEYEAEGQMHLWNPDEPSAPRKPSAPLPGGFEAKLREACEELNVPWDRCAGHTELLSVCERLGLEVTEDFLLSVAGDGAMNVQDFVSRVLNHSKPATPSASTPYRQLKRLHSTQPFDEGGRRIATPSGLTSTIGTRLFSTLDDGTGFTPAELVLDAWVDEGIENSTEILQALNFDLDNKLSLSDLTMALENELLVTKNGIHQAALASFKAEIRHLLERIDREVREKEKIRSDLDKAERLQSQLATEVDEHHSAIEHTNNLKIKKLEQEHKERVAAVRSELMQEMDLMQQQASLQREELEAAMEKIREDESFLRDHLSISVKENRRLEMELLDSTEKLVDTESQVTKLQTHLDNVMKEKFGDLDPGSAEFFLTEERIRQMRSGFEVQCRELQDRIDELQSELQEFHGLGRVHQPCTKPLSEELESKSPGMESDPGIGSEEVQPFSMSLEVEMMLEQLKEQHLQEMEELRSQLESKIKDVDQMVDRRMETHDDQSSILALQLQQEVRDLREELTRVQGQARELRSQLEQAELDRQSLERRRAEEREELENLREEEVGSLRQQLLEVHTCTADLEEQLKNLEAERAAVDGVRHADLEALKERHAAELRKVQEEPVEVSEVRLEEEVKKLQQEREEMERRTREELRELRELEVREKVEEARSRCAKEQDEAVQRLREQWQRERERLDEQNNESLQLLLEEEMLRLAKEHEERDGKLRGEWEEERAGLRGLHEAGLLDERSRSEQREKKLRAEWERERLQLEEDYEGMVEERLSEEREKMEAQRQEEEKRLGNLMEEERAVLEERHREAVTELQAKHGEEREALSRLLDKLRDDFAQERREIQISFTQRIKEVDERFSGDQRSIEERFQADVLKLEQHYQRHLQGLSESHGEEKLRWEAQMQEASENAEEQRRTMEREMERERARLIQDWTKERGEQERIHGEEVEGLKISNRNLQNELEDAVSLAQTKEIELSRQLNDLHNRLQDSLETKDQLLAEWESRALQAELLLSQTVEDFKMERAELEENQSQLQTRLEEMTATSEGQVAERIVLMTERDDLRVKIEELELLLKQAAEDFELDRKELREQMSALEEKVLSHVEGDREAAREMLVDRIEELARELDDASREEVRERGGVITFTEEGIQMTNLDDDDDDDDDDEGNTLEVKINEEDDSRPGSDEDAESLLKSINNNKESVSAASRPEEFGVGEADVGRASCEDDNKPQDLDSGSFSHEEERGHEAVVAPGGTGDPAELNLEVAEVVSSPNALHRREQEAQSVWEEIKDDCVGRSREESCRERQDESLENVLLQERILLLQQKTEILESLLAHSSERVRTGQQVLEENYGLKVKMVLLMEHAKVLEVKALKMADVQIRYEDCACENAKLREQNCELERRVWSLETRMNVFRDFQDEQLALMDEVARVRAENGGLLALLREPERQQAVPGSHAAEEGPLGQPEVKAVSDLEGCCDEFEKQNSELRRAVAELHDESLTLNETTQANRSEACRLAEENLLLRQKIAALKEEDLKEAQEELTRTLEHLRNEKGAAQKSTETFQKQILELRSQSQRFESENGILRRQLSELMKEKEKREALLAEDKDELAACVSSLEAELKRALGDSAQLEERNAELLERLSDLRVKRVKFDSMENQLTNLLQERRKEDVENQGLRNQLAKAQERVKTMDESCQSVNHQSARLKADVRVAQKERDSLKHDVSILHKQLQNAKDKNHVLEKALRSSGLQSPSRRLHRDEAARVMEQEQQLLRQENERLQAEVRAVKGDLAQSRERVRQLDAAMKQHRQQSQSALLKALEQENAALRQELEAQREKSKGCEAGQGHVELESLQQENEELKAQMARLSTQVLESFQAHLVGLLPPSPHRTPRGHRGDDGDNMQDHKERKMKNMEERMREIEMSQHNVKLLLKEKVAQLKEQLSKNSKADVLIQDLYVENAQLLKALDITEQRHKITEKKNYLLEEKISSLNKIVRDLNPSPLPSVPYHYK